MMKLRLVISLIMQYPRVHLASRRVHLHCVLLALQSRQVGLVLRLRQRGLASLLLKCEVLLLLVVVQLGEVGLLVPHGRW